MKPTAASLPVGGRIRELRTRRGETQEQLALVLGITPQAVSRWELAHSYPDLELLPILATHFSVSTDYLLGVNPAEA